MGSTGVFNEVVSSSHTAIPVRVKTLSERDRRRLLMHFLELDSSGRQICFGSVLPDELITKYVQKVNFSRDAIFGIYDGEHKLIGTGHLAFLPREAVPAATAATSKERIAEFGVSVSAEARGKGVGTRLLERVISHCRSADIDILYTHCPAAEPALAHIAERTGLEIYPTDDSTHAYLRIAHPGVLPEAAA